ncbi:MAG: hypothetical protein FJZ92_13940 [Chloroflexi bacterium]|nr:hypothetical protein [Chloroflexota bacterium]
MRPPARGAPLVLAAEKVLQHAFVTRAFAADRFGVREQVAVDYRWLTVLGALAGIGFLVAIPGRLARRRRAAWLLLALVALDVAGEFVAQGTALAARVLARPRAVSAP